MFTNKLEQNLLSISIFISNYVNKYRFTLIASIFQDKTIQIWILQHYYSAAKKKEVKQNTSFKMKK